VQTAGGLVVAASNLPPAWSVVKITSSALFFVFGCLSTGMPRPSSVTVIDAPSA